MKIFITVPSFAIHGGIRVILEWANRLSVQHRVCLRLLKGPTDLPWFRLDPSVRLVTDDHDLGRSDLLIVTSPHAAAYLTHRYPVKKVIFLQMLEHLFQPKNAHWKILCEQLYKSEHPLITISSWGADQLRDLFQRTGPTHLVGNGVNLQDFPIDALTPKDGRTVLVEGWVSGNSSKDPESHAPAVAARLRVMGYRILAYSALPNVGPNAKIPHEFYLKPSLEQLNMLYTRATILLKASQWDFRACAPVEAMTKGTVTARALRLGDDDLVDNVNCLRCCYDRDALELRALRLLQDGELRNRLSDACLKHVQTYTWDYWIPIIESILWS